MSIAELFNAELFSSPDFGIPTSDFKLSARLSDFRTSGLLPLLIFQAVFVVYFFDDRCGKFSLVVQVMYLTHKG